MKTIWLLPLVLFASTAFANCPELTGRYRCVTKGGAEGKLKVSQEMTNGSTLYTLSGDQPFQTGSLLADGVRYHDPYFGDWRDVTRRAWCADDGLLRFHTHATYKDGVGSHDQQDTYSMTNDGFNDIFSLDRQGYMKFDFADVSLDSSSFRCVREN